MLLQTIRDRATSWIAYIIIGLLIVTFAIWGIGSYFSEPNILAVAEVGDATISQQAFQQAYQQQRTRLQTMLGDRFDPAAFDEERLKHDVLQQLISEQLLAEAASTAGLRVGNRQLQQAIVNNAAFQRDGAFDPELYQRRLRAQGYTDVMYEEDLRKALVTDRLREGLTGSAFVTPAALNAYAELLNQQREIDYVLLAMDKYRDKAAVDEAEIEANYQENQNRFLKPEQVQLQYLELKLEDIANRMTVAEDELRASYEQQIAKYTRPEERGASHILITVPEQADAAQLEQARTRAQDIYGAIAGGAKTFQQVMDAFQAEKTEGVEAQSLGVITAGMLDPAFESALFNLKTAGDVREPVQTPFGFHIIRLDSVTPESVKSFAEARDDVARDLRLSKAEEQFYETVETLSSFSFEQPDSLEPAARQLGLPIAETPWLTRAGGDGIGAYPKAMEAAFGEDVLVNGLNSDPVEVEPNHVVVLRVKEHQEAAPKTLAEARDEIAQQLRTRKAREMMDQDARTLQDKAAQGQALAALAETFGGELKSPGLITRQTPGIDSALLAAAFQLPRPETGDAAEQIKPSLGLATLANGDRAVIAVKRVAPGNPEDLPEEQRKNLTQRLTQQIGATDFQNFLNSLRAQIKIVTHGDRL